LWLIETLVFQMPQLHKHLNVSGYLKTMRKFLKIFIVLISMYAVVIALTWATCPIIAKWLTGSARLIGKPTTAKVYTNGHVNTTIDVYSVDNYFLLYRHDLNRIPEVIAVFPDGNWVGTPVGGSELDYAKYSGILFQSEIGGHFVSFNDGAKRNNSFNPILKRDNRIITFLMSPEINDFGCDSMRIEL
jgi:hypothetical protein